MNSRTVLGALLMLVGSVLLYPAVSVSANQLLIAALAPAVLLLSAGTYLVGTDVSGAPV